MCLSIRSGRRALTFAKEIKNIWVHITSAYDLTFSLLEAGAYEEALGLIQSIQAQARTLPLTLIYQRFLMTLGNTYHALQQWEEARSTFEEADALAEILDVGKFRVLALSQYEQAINHLHEAAGLAADLGLPGEQWQIQETLGRLYKAEGKLAQAHTASTEATMIIQRLAKNTGDETLRTRFLAGPQNPVFTQER